MPMSKTELRQQMRLFLLDRRRGIPISLFADLCGLHKETLRKCFVTEEWEITEFVQLRVLRAFTAWMAGEIRVMVKRDRTKYVEWRKSPQPRMYKHAGLTFEDGMIKLDIGPKNRADYSRQPLFKKG